VPTPRPEPVDRAFFEAHGWVVVRGVLGAQAVASLAKALDGVVPPDAYRTGYEGRVVEVAGVSMGSPVLGRLARDVRLARLAAAALGTARVQLLQDTVFIKPARTGGPVAWHQDGSYFAFLRPLHGLALRVALTPCTPASGCLRVVDGSHRWGLVTGDLSFRATSVDDILGALPEPLREQARRATVEVPLEPGDVSLHHCLTLHASGPNRSTSTRKTLAIRYVDPACTVDPARVPHDAAARVPFDDAMHLSTDAYPLVG